MTNLEKYLPDILKLSITNGTPSFAITEQQSNKILIKPCHAVPCMNCLLHRNPGCCSMNRYKWLAEEYKELEVDWSTIPVDTKIYVRDRDDQSWEPRYFSHYDSEHNIVYAFIDGATSWSVGDTNSCVVGWRKQAKLAEKD